MLSFVQYLEESSLDSDQIIKNPSLMKLGVYADKDIKLRYYKWNNDVYIGNAEHMYHGEIADNIGAGRNHWRYEALTGFIYAHNYPAIKALGFKNWVEKRHKASMAGGKDEYGYGGRYIPDPGDSANDSYNDEDDDNRKVPEVSYPKPGQQPKPEIKINLTPEQEKWLSLYRRNAQALQHGEVKVSAHDRGDGKVHAHTRKRPQLSMSLRR